MVSQLFQTLIITKYQLDRKSTPQVKVTIVMSRMGLYSACPTSAWCIARTVTAGRVAAPPFEPVRFQLSHDHVGCRARIPRTRRACERELGPTGVVMSSASVSETKPTPTAWSSWSVAIRSSGERPHRSSRYTTMASTSRRRAARSSSSRLGRVLAREPTSFSSIAIFQPRRLAYSRVAASCIGRVC
jgi:hypothetical protein